MRAVSLYRSPLLKTKQWNISADHGTGHRVIEEAEWTQSILISLAVVAAVCFSACGARTALEVEPCGDTDHSRTCATSCGEGVQLCDGARWGPCEVSPLMLPCMNACGEGVALCADGALGECALEPRSVACMNACGEGVAACVDGAVSECVVEPRSVACANACGEGVATCAGGAVGECLVEPRSVVCTNACGAGFAECREGELADCEVALTERPCSSECGDGVEVCVDGRYGPCSADTPLPPVLQVTLRDFREAHPDFEAVIGDDRGFVRDVLGGDGRPVYSGPSPTTHGRELFDQWYRDVPGVNASAEIELPLASRPEEPGRFEFSELEFFPIDDRLLGNEGREHNFYFTLEATGEFVYNGGETFRFEGDDDFFVFINRRLAIDLGGVHARQEAIISLDEIAAAFGLRVGETYSIHLFFAERHTSRSTFTIDTTITRTLRCE